MKDKINSCVAIDTEGPLYCEPITIYEISELSTLSATPKFCAEFQFTIEVPPVSNEIASHKFDFKIADLTPFVAILSAAFVAYKFVAERNEARRKDEISKLEDSLKTLYGPLKELREESKRLYEIFAVDLKDQHMAEFNERFRTLTFLRQNSPDALPEYDLQVLKHIIDISRKNIDFIEANGWAIESTALSTLLGNLCAHFRVMEIASDGKLVGASDKFEDIVFPLETDGAIDNEIKKIQRKIESLSKQNRHPTRSWFMNKLKRVSSTIEFYNENADSYYLQTNHIDMSPSYQAFRKYLRPGGRVLDAGCGVGRDTRFFISKGYKVHSFDLSEKMCKITSRYPFSFCEQMSFLDVDFYEQFDGVWANASLLHLTPKDLGEALKRLVRSLSLDGVLFASFKTTDNYVKNDKRKFYFHTSSILEEIISTENLGIELIETWKSFKNNDETQEAFESYIWKRVQ
ncbi:methyltransferase domain-containing protein [Vibrio toranzoniae]|uniref:class I SAM-dependent methyltransferase n=1 Tax=Vibrio TaxID=662 RepID=UPI001376F365|nr:MULTISPECIES: class I SAM-dependent methyltransferase [Vibrio]NAZ53751.1 methyltransferase domain-containing protein [Vibrio toranzoniae]NOH18495.1 class I SAM-dependent methyltransferase [Vibrio cyclitrophicus]